MSAPAATLLSVPNVSEGRNARVIGEIVAAFDGRVLAVHSDPDHHRSVVTLAGAPGELAGHVVAGAHAAVDRIDLRRHEGIHPRVGAIDVAPIVYLSDSDRGAACAEALVLGDRLGEELELPVFLYGALGGGRTRAELRRGGPTHLAERLDAGELRPDFGPRHLHPSAGAVLVAARPPLVAFNLELGPASTLEDARRVAALIREGGAEGLPGVRALGLWLEHRSVPQVSINVEDHLATPLGVLLAAVARHAEPVRGELIAPAPEAAFAGLPVEFPVANRRTIEDALSAVS